MKNDLERGPDGLVWQYCCRCGELKPADAYLQPKVHGAGRRPRTCDTCRTPHDRTQTCEHCSNEYTPPRSDSRYCSGRCRTAAHRARR